MDSCQIPERRGQADNDLVAGTQVNASSHASRIIGT